MRPARRRRAEQDDACAVGDESNAIDIVKADGTLLANNHVTYASERGRGVAVEFDSDHNAIINNTIVSTDNASTGQVQLSPGGSFVEQTAVMDNGIQCVLQDRSLRNIVLDGELVQMERFDVVLTNPPFGTRGANQVRASPRAPRSGS